MSQTAISSSGVQLFCGAVPKARLFFVEIGCESDAAVLRRFRVHQFAYRGEDCGDRLIVVRQLFLETRLELIEFSSELSIRDQQLPHTDEGRSEERRVGEECR